MGSMAVARALGAGGASKPARTDERPGARLRLLIVARTCAGRRVVAAVHASLVAVHASDLHRDGLCLLAPRPRGAAAVRSHDAGDAQRDGPADGRAPQRGHRGAVRERHVI